jgi:PAS domain S-box-containing protein
MQEIVDGAPRGGLGPTLREQFLRYGAGLLATALGLGARLALEPWLGLKLPYVTLFAAAMLAAWLGGLGPGLACVAFSTAGAMWLWLPPVHSFAIADPGDAIGLALYATLASVTVLVMHWERRATRRLESVLARSSATSGRAREILDSIGDSFYALDRDFRFTYLNPQAAEYFGRAPQALLGLSIWEAMPEKRGTVFETSFRQALWSNRPVRFEGRSPVTGKWVDVQVYPSEGRSGLSIFVRDLSDRRARQLGEERMKAILSSATDAIITIDEDERISLFSAGAEHIFRCSASEAIGQPIDRFIPARHRVAHHGFIRAFGETGVSTRQMGGERVLAALRADGEEFPMEARISQSTAAGEKLYTVILRDVTERKQAEREREQLLERARIAAVQAERANRAKDDFLATVSHELRTPLTPILTWCRLLVGRPADEETLRRGLLAIERSARSQAQLIEDLLDISRIVAGKVRLDVQRIPVAPVIDAAIESLRPAAEAKEIRLEVVLDPRAGLVSADRERLQQVMWNLISNAIKFTPKGGRVNVVLQRINSHLEIVVRDTGKGIAPEFLPYVFDRFRQDEATTTRVHGGLGLGLAIVRHIVELHGGSVRCESAGVGRGAVFTVALPLAPLQAPLSPDEVHPSVGEDGGRPPLPSLEGLRVLVVDDEHDTLDALATVLLESGAEVRTAPSARRALEILADWMPNVLISDLGMPEEDGYALIRRVRQLPPHAGGSVPALALTAYARVEDRLRVLSAGFQMHVPKPIEPSELIAIVSSVSSMQLRL